MSDSGLPPENRELPPDLDPHRGRPTRSQQRQAGRRSNAGDGRGQGYQSLPPDMDPRTPGRSPVRRRGTATRGVFLGVKIMAATLSLAVLVGSGWAWATFRTFTGNIRRVDIGAHTAAGSRKHRRQRAEHLDCG